MERDPKSKLKSPTPELCERIIRECWPDRRLSAVKTLLDECRISRLKAFAIADKLFASAAEQNPEGRTDNTPRPVPENMRELLLILDLGYFDAAIKTLSDRTGAPVEDCEAELDAIADEWESSVFIGADPLLIELQSNLMDFYPDRMPEARLFLRLNGYSEDEAQIITEDMLEGMEKLYGTLERVTVDPEVFAYYKSYSLVRFYTRYFPDVQKGFEWFRDCFELSDADAMFYTLELHKLIKLQLHLCTLLCEGSEGIERAEKWYRHRFNVTPNEAKLVICLVYEVFMDD